LAAVDDVIFDTRVFLKFNTNSSAMADNRSNDVIARGRGRFAGAPS
jgi:hypothetical protein